MFKKEIFQVKGMNCASCAANIEKTLKKAKWIISAEVNYGTETAKVEFEDGKTDSDKMSELIKPLGYSLILKHDEGKTSDNHVDHAKQEKISDDKIIILSPIFICDDIPAAEYKIFGYGFKINWL